MNFQENRFPIILGIVTGVLAIGLLSWGISNAGKYSAAKERYDSTVSEIDNLTSEPIYPDPENRQAKETAVSEYSEEVAELQEAFDSYRKTEFENVEAGVFTDALLAAEEEVAASFEEVESRLPEGFFLGFESYTTSTVSENITGVLGYQLDGFTEMFKMLASASPSRVINVHRPRLAEEGGGEFDAEGRSSRHHSIQVAFSGTESTLREFLSALDDSETHYFSSRLLRLRNQRTTAPNAGDALFEAAETADAGGGSDSPFGDFVFPDADDGAEEGEEPAEADVAAEPAAPADTGEILKQVLGSEQIDVMMQVDLIQFLEPQPLPRG